MIHIEIRVSAHTGTKEAHLFMKTQGGNYNKYQVTENKFKHAFKWFSISAERSW